MTAALAVLSGTILLFLSGCSQFDQHRDELANLHAAGRYDQAAAALDDPDIRDLYGDRNEVLWQLDRGAVALARNDQERSIQLLEDAERTIEWRRERSLGANVAQWTINDRQSAYIAEPYEDMYVNVLKLLAQLERGVLVGGATVEARRLGSKADALRDAYLKYEAAATRQERDRLGPVRRSAGLVATNEAGEFVESPLGTYLSAITFMKTGNPEFQRVAGHRLVESIGLQRGFSGQARAEDFTGVAEMDPRDGNVLVVALSGRGPTKYAERLGPILLYTVPMYFELPKLRTYPSEVAGARVVVEGGAGGGVGGSEGGVPMALVEDLSAVANENHRRTLPLIYTRTLTRAAVKAGVSVAVTEGLRRSAADSDQGWVQILGALAGLAAMASTERADLRSWIFLPGQARVALLKLPPGEQRVRVEYLGSSGGTLYASEWRTVTPTENGLSTVVVHYWR